MMSDVIDWLESDEGQEWSRRKHRSASGHEKGVFGSLKPVRSSSAAYTPRWTWIILPIPTVPTRYVRVYPEFSNLPSPA